MQYKECASWCVAKRRTGALQRHVACAQQQARLLNRVPLRHGALRLAQRVPAHHVLHSRARPQLRGTHALEGGAREVKADARERRQRRNLRVCHPLRRRRLLLLLLMLRRCRWVPC